MTTRVYMMPDEPSKGTELKDKLGNTWVRTGGHDSWGNWWSNEVNPPYPLSWLKLLTTHGPLYQDGV